MKYHFYDLWLFPRENPELSFNMVVDPFVAQSWHEVPMMGDRLV